MQPVQSVFRHFWLRHVDLLIAPFFSPPALLSPGIRSATVSPLPQSPPVSSARSPLCSRSARRRSRIRNRDSGISSRDRKISRVPSLALRSVPVSRSHPSADLRRPARFPSRSCILRSEEHTSELQS